MIIRGYSVKNNALLIYSDKGIISLHNSIKGDRNSYKTVSHCRFAPISEKIFYDISSWSSPEIDDDDDYEDDDDYDSFPLH